MWCGVVCSPSYLAGLQLGLLLAALPADGLDLAEAELAQQVTGAAQQVAGEAQLPARLRRQLSAVRRQLKVDEVEGAGTETTQQNK